MQRVAIGRALVRRPKALLMDEPIGALDAKLREEMRTELKRLHLENDATTVYVTHDQVEAMSMADRIAIMNEGVLQQVGTPTEVYQHPGNAVRRPVHRQPDHERGERRRAPGRRPHDRDAGRERRGAELSQPSCIHVIAESKHAEDELASACGPKASWWTRSRRRVISPWRRTSSSRSAPTTSWT